ncbi:MAG: hypothetical protein H0U75_03375 [Legionella sp.]|nr:hypothetical protein [Legionella sp.]
MFKPSPPPQVVAQIDKNQLIEFEKKLLCFVGRRISYKWNPQLLRFLGLGFFDMTPQERYNILRGLDHHFLNFLQNNTDFAYHLLINSVNNLPELLVKLRATHLGQDFIIPIELEHYHETLTKFLGVTVSNHFSSGLYHHLSPNFFNKTTAERYEELNLLRLNPDFMSYFEPNEACYQFLIKSVDNSPEHIEKLKSNRLGQFYLIPRELQLFNEQLIILVGSQVSKNFSDMLYKYITLDFFKKTPKDRFTYLCAIRKTPGFFNDLLQDKMQAYNFLRKSLDDSPELLAQLETNRLGQFCLIPPVLAKFNQQMASFIGDNVSRAFTDEMFKYLSPTFFVKTPEDRYSELFTLRLNPAFFYCLRLNTAVAQIFLQKCVNNCLQLIQALKTNRLGQHFLIQERHVRKRKLDFSSKDNTETNTYINHIKENRAGSLFPYQPQETVEHGAIDLPGFGNEIPL